MCMTRNYIVLTHTCLRNRLVIPRSIRHRISGIVPLLAVCALLLIAGCGKNDSADDMSEDPSRDRYLRDSSGCFRMPAGLQTRTPIACGMIAVGLRPHFTVQSIQEVIDSIRGSLTKQEGDTTQGLRLLFRVSPDSLQHALTILYRHHTSGPVADACSVGMIGGNLTPDCLSPAIIIDPAR